MDRSLRQASAVVAEDNKDNLLNQLEATLEQARAEMNQARGAARQRAAETVALLQQLQQLQHLQELRSRQISEDEAQELIKALHKSSEAFAKLQASNQNVRGRDGLTITERMRNEQAEVADRERLLSLIRDIKAQRDEDIESRKEEAKSIKEFGRSGLSAFLGPAGPMYTLFHELKQEYGADAKKLGSNFARLIGFKRDELREFGLEAERENARRTQLFSMLNWSFNRLTGLFGQHEGGALDSILDRLGLGRGGRSGKGRWSTRMRRAARTMGRRIGRAARRIGGRLGRATRGIGRVLGRGGRILGKGLRFGGKMIPGLGLALGAYDMYQMAQSSLNKGVTGEDRFSDYADGALSGAGIGMMAGPIGAAVGAIIGLGFTAVVRNWSSLKSSVQSGWETTTSVMLKGWNRVLQFGQDFVDGVSDTWSSIKKKAGELIDWFKTVIPTADQIRSFAKGKAVQVRDAVQGRVASAMGSVAGYAQNVANKYGSNSLIGSVAQSVSNFAGSLSMPSSQVQSAISDAAKAKGVDIGTMMATVGQESSFRPTAGAGTSSAKGLGQFTDGKWAEMVQKYGAQEGIGLNDVYDPKKNATMLALATRDNGNALTKAGLSSGPAELYAMHMLGSSGGLKFLQMVQNSPNTVAASIFSVAARNNHNVFYEGNRPRTFMEVYQWFQTKIGAQAQAYNNQLGAKYTSNVTFDTNAATASASKASVAPSTESYQRVPSRKAQANVNVQAPPKDWLEQISSPATTRGTQTRGVSVGDVPMVLGDPPYIIVNSGAVGS